MPIEYLLLKNKNAALNKCPVCKDKPFDHFLRGQVQRRRKTWILQRKRDYCAVICSKCKNTVGWESP